MRSFENKRKGVLFRFVVCHARMMLRLWIIGGAWGCHEEVWKGVVRRSESTSRVRVIESADQLPHRRSEERGSHSNSKRDSSTRKQTANDWQPTNNTPRCNPSTLSNKCVEVAVCCFRKRTMLDERCKIRLRMHSNVNEKRQRSVWKQCRVVFMRKVRGLRRTSWCVRFS